MSEITVKFKDFKKNIHPVQVAPEASVADTKQQLCDALQNGTAVDQIKLIYSGKVLANPKTVASYGIKDQDHVIFMVSKKKQPSPAPAQDTAPKVTDPILAESASALEPASVPETASTADAPAPETAAPEAAAAAATADAPPAEFVTRLMELGYSHAEAVMALQLANNDPNRACELLLMGLTEQDDNDQDAHMDLGDDHEDAAGEHIAGEGEGDDDNDDDDLFAQAAAAAGGSAPAGSGAAGAAGSQQPRSISLTMEDLMQLRRIVNGDPESLQPFLENMISRYPQLEDQIQRSPEMFLAMLLEGLGGNIPGDLDDQMQMGGAAAAAGSLVGEDEAGAAPPANTIQLTQEENDAINRLCELGNFERNLVIQIYFACDKNEEIAANMLFMEHSTD